MSERNERFRESLRGLAASAAGEPPLSGPELRRLAERRHRRRLLAVPALALSGLLVGGTAFAISGVFGPAPRPVPPVSGGAPSASAPGIAPSATDTPHPSEPHPSLAPSRPGDPAAPTASGRVTPTGPSVSATSALPDPGKVVACAAAQAGETLVRLHALQLPGTLAPGVDALLYAVPVTCVHGQLTLAGAGQWLRVVPDAVVTTTAPLSAGAGSSLSTLAGLATGLTQHPEQLFGIRRDAEGRVYRLDQVPTGK
ncbi:hypothetical protein ABIA33_003926 [Streptacidiphilus sp. MAP12-16]|uniref:hypothetical protein n=1 Tax=Streptacidiphilus sp. MAP12-16 TaxID=3156300 RepID=UPI003514B474